MNGEVFIAGEYISGIIKRPDLVGQPCVLVYGDDGFILSVLAGEEPEVFNFPYDSIDSIKANLRLVVSENMGKSKDYPWVYAKLLGFALSGYRGYIQVHSAERSNRAFNNTIGKMEYNKRQELIIEYHDETGYRRMLIYANSNPKSFIKHFNDIKK